MDSKYGRNKKGKLSLCETCAYVGGFCQEKNLHFYRCKNYVMDALKTQVGGTHYKNLPYQPVELIAKLDLNFFQGNIIKYLSRYKGKNGKEDLQKAIHYAELANSLNVNSYVFFGENLFKELGDYCEKNNFGKDILEILTQVVYQNWLSSVVKICNLIKKTYND